MQSVSGGFAAHSRLKTRRPSFKVLIDWDLDGDYDDESDNVLSIEGDRSINEPLNGIYQAQADIKLSNVSNRYSPESTSVIADDIKIKRRIQILNGFFGDNIAFINGINEIPLLDEEKKEVDIHLWDEMERLRDFKLSDGAQLFTDIRSDRYIWKILDEVYDGYFTIIASFDISETITGGTAETTNHRGGDRAYKLSATSGGTDSAYKTVSLDLSGYASTDKITCFVFIEDVTKVQSLILRLHTTAGVNYGSYELINYPLITGWNQIEVLKSNITITGSFNWASIVRAEFILDAVASQDVYAIVDELRIIDIDNYPLRTFDVGLQNIPVATFGGNTANYEIKSACECEGARGFFDENGRFHFENRQFYNNNAAYKVSVLQLTFDNLKNYQHPKPDQGVINSVDVKINPRVIVSEKEIWKLGEIPSIANGATKTIWASFTDPVPVTASGLVTPVITTDYTANDNADGGGASRTANISIVITKFTNAAKLEITNNHSSSVYLTLMKLRGTPAEEQGKTTIRVQDQDSIDTYGILSYTVETKYLASSDYAQTLGQQIIDWYKNPLDRLLLENPALPQLQIGDMISVINEYTSEGQLARIMGINFSMNKGEIFRQKIYTRSIAGFEALDFFTIGTSSIESDDVISP